jgi:hypothetical protein
MYVLIGEDRDSAVGIATGNGLDGGGVGIRVLVGVRLFSSPCLPDGSCGPPSLLPKGYLRALSSGVQPGRETDHSPPTRAGVKNT